MKTLIVGAKGFIGRHFYSFYRSIHPTIATHYKKEEGYVHLDLMNPNINFDLGDCQYAIIAGGIVSPKKCEENPELAYKANVEGIFLLSKQLVKKNVTPIFLSSGYVFNGIKGCYLESDPVSPINIYGKQKVELENLLLNELKDKCLIIRLSKVYGTERGDLTLLDEMASSLFQNKKILAADNQILSPISIAETIQTILIMQKKNVRGLYHLGGIKSLSRYEIALTIAKEVGVDKKLVQRISLDEISSSFPRPKRSDLIAEKIFKETNYIPQSLEDDIKLMAHQFVNSSKNGTFL